MKYTSLLLATAFIANEVSSPFSVDSNPEANPIVFQASANNDLLKIKDFWDVRANYYSQTTFWSAMLDAMQDTTAQEALPEEAQAAGIG